MSLTLNDAGGGLIQSIGQDSGERLPFLTGSYSQIREQMSGPEIS